MKRFQSVVRLYSDAILLTITCTFILLGSCSPEKEIDPGPKPQVKTMSVLDVSLTEVLSAGEVTSEGDAPVTERGVLITKGGSPSFDEMRVKAGSGAGIFSCAVDSLEVSSWYAVQAYATNSYGTSLGKLVEFKTGVVLDADGNVYHSVRIGSQDWLVENLRTTRFNDSTDIPYVEAEADWNAVFDPACCWYNNDKETNKPLYGALYNWAAVNSGKLSPPGWHVPTPEEWGELFKYVGGSKTAASKLKEKGDLHWTSPNTGASNDYGFNALPGSFRSTDGTFGTDGYYGYWWSTLSVSASEAAAYCMITNRAEVYDQRVLKGSGLSVRCIKTKL